MNGHQDPTGAAGELADLRERNRHLAQDKAYLQLVIQLMERINPLTGLDAMVADLLNGIVETIGGTNIRLWYWVGDELRYADFVGGIGTATAIDDPLASQAAETSRFVELELEPDAALLRDGTPAGAWNWAFPLLAGDELVGVIKLENLHISGARLREYLPMFFRHVALIVSNEARSILRQRADARFEATFQQAAVGIAHVAPDGRWLKVNRKLCEIVGYPEDELLSGAFLDIIHPDDLEAELHYVTRMLRRELDTYAMEKRYLRRDGTAVWVNLTVALAWKPDGSPDYFISVVEDIHERKQIEAELKEYRSHLEALVEQRSAELAQTQFAMDRAGIGIHWVDAHSGRFIYVNDYASKLLGYSRDELLAMGVQDVDPSFQAGDFWEATAHLRALRSATIETTERHKDGHLIPIEVTFYYQQDQEATGGRFIAFITDVTERHASQQALQQAKEAAEAASVAKSSFLANMSHEIRTPLHAITGMVHLVRRAGVNAEQARWLGKIDVAGQHLLDIINAILDLSKIEAGKFPLEESELHLDEIAANAAAMLADRAQAKGVRLLVESPPLPAHLLGDATRIRQGLLNYANNAVKFTETGSVTLRVLVEEEMADAALIRFEVQDTGIGIPPEAMPRLFNAFEQADNTTTRKYGGTGLGLAITKKLAELMGGTAGAVSEPGVGSTFWFTAKLRKAAPPPHAATRHTADTAEAMLKRDFADRRLLVVDDDPDNLEITCALLKHVWPHIDTAMDGLEAVDRVRANRYDLILMDMRMPRMDGLTATRRIRELPNGAGIPILAMTANVFPEDKARCLEAGMNDVIPKAVGAAAPFSSLLKWLSSPTA